MILALLPNASAGVHGDTAVQFYSLQEHFPLVVSFYLKLDSNSLSWSWSEQLIVTGSSTAVYSHDSLHAHIYIQVALQHSLYDSCIAICIQFFFLHDQRDFTLALHACIRWTCFVSSRQQLVSRTPRYTATRKVTSSQKLELQRHLLLTTFNWFNTNLSTNKSKWTWKSLRVCGPMGLAQELSMTRQVAWKVQVPSQLSTLCKSCIDYCTKKKRQWSSILFESDWDDCANLVIDLYGMKKEHYFRSSDRNWALQVKFILTPNLI